MASFNLEQNCDVSVIGVDEAGRGPWAGPVVVAGVRFHRYEELPAWVSELDDSKKLSIKKRNLLYEAIIQSQDILTFCVAEVDVKTIDTVNILEATLQGMRTCVQTLRLNNEVVLVDGTISPIKEFWCQCIPKGDSLSYSIAAASIIAKVHRDKYMQQISLEFPVYGWEKNAGYGTAKHAEAIQIHGITHHHRKSFAPIRRLCV